MTDRAILPTPDDPAPKGVGSISVIIPVWRDFAALGALLPILSRAPEVHEVIVAAAEPQAGVANELETAGVRLVDAGGPNRGRQMDAGAEMAKGRWLLFHHVDSQLTAMHLAALAALDADSAAVGGAFYRRFDERHPAMRRFEKIERWHNRSFGALYGDQSIFARREVFAALGGFRGLPLMEDVDFSHRLRRAGKIELLDPPMSSSPRRHLARGPWRMTLMNTLLLAFFHLGVSPQRLHRWYYRARPFPIGNLRRVPDSAPPPTNATLVP